MRNRSLILVAVLALAILVLCFSEQNNSANGNFFPVPSLYVWVHFNASQGNCASITFSVEAHVSMDTAIVSIRYNIDDSTNVTSTDFTSRTWFPEGTNAQPNNHNQYFATITIERVSFGNHTLKVYLFDAEGGGLSRDMDFLLTANSTKVYSSSGPSVNPSDYNSTPTPTPTVPEYSIAGAMCLLAVASIPLIYFRRKDKLATKQSF